MKKILAILLAVMLVFSLVACRNSDGKDNDKNNDDDISGVIDDALNGNGAIETPIIDMPLN